eukprot:1194267-Prorocentrum_minimum.AAC.3
MASFEKACGEIVTFLQGNPNEVSAMISLKRLFCPSYHNPPCRRSVLILLVEDNLPNFPAGALGTLKAGLELCGLDAFTSATGYDPSSPPTLRYGEPLQIQKTYYDNNNNTKFDIYSTRWLPDRPTRWILSGDSLVP